MSIHMFDVHLSSVVYKTPSAPSQILARLVRLIGDGGRNMSIVQALRI